MQDIITTIVAQQLAEWIIALVIAALGTAGTFAMAQLTRLLGEKRAAEVRAMLDDAIRRAIEAARAKGLDGAQAEAWVQDYIRTTMRGTLAKLKATDRDLAKRVGAQMAGTRAPY